MKRQRIITAVLGLPVRQINGQNEYLLTKRHAPHNPKFHNKWQLAGGGLEFGEKPEEALVREFQEELSVIPEIINPSSVVLTSTWIGGDDDTKDDVHIILIGFLVDIKDQTPVIADPDEETGDFGWFNKEQAMRLESLPQTREFVEKLSNLSSISFHLNN